jgi:hypothetical protein
MAAGIRTQLDQSYAQKVKQQFNILMEELNKQGNVNINLNTSELANKLKQTTKSIEETLKIYSQLGEVSANKLQFDDNGKLQNFNVQLERTKGIIENIGYSLNKGVFSADGVTVTNKQKELVQKIAEDQVQQTEKAEQKAEELANKEYNKKTELEQKWQELFERNTVIRDQKAEEENNKLAEQMAKEVETNNELIEQEDTKLKVIQMQYEQKLKNVQTNANELNNEELNNRINTFQDNLYNTASTGTIGQQQLKNDYQDIVNLEDELIAKKKEEQGVTANLFQEQARIAKLGELVGTLPTNIFNKSDKDIKAYIESLYGADAKIVSFKRSLDGLSDSQVKVTVNTKNSKNEIEQEKLILDENTNYVYKNEEAIKANTSRMVGFADRLKNAFTAVASLI